MVKKAVSMLLLITLGVMTLLSGCSQKQEVPKGDSEVQSGGREMVGNMYKTGLPVVKDKVTLKVAVSRPNHVGAYAEMAWTKQVEDMTNVHVEWIEFPTDGLAEKVNIMLASGDYPDIAWGRLLGDNHFSTYGPAGTIVKLNDLMDKYAPNWANVLKKYPYVKKVITGTDGAIYSLPYIRMDDANAGMRDAWVINKSWLDKLGMKMPATTEEFRQTLKAFKEKDPNGNGKADEIPWTFRFNGYSNGQFDIFGSFGILHGAYTSNLNIGIQNGKVIYTATQPQVKEALKYLNVLYKEGLIDKESFTQNASQYQAKLKATPEIVGSTSVFHGVTEFGQEKMEKEVYTAMPALKGPNGETPKWRQQTNTVERGFFTIFSTNKNPEISMRWANELANEELSLQSLYGMIGTYIKKGADGKYDIDTAKYADRGKDVPLNFGPFFVSPEIVSSVKRQGSDEIRSKFYNIYKPYVVPLEEIYPPVVFNKEQDNNLAKYNTDLNKYVSDMHAKFIVEGGIDEGWDAFVKKVNDLKVDEVLKVYQQALDSFNKN